MKIAPVDLGNNRQVERFGEELKFDFAYYKDTIKSHHERLIFKRTQRFKT